MDHVASELRQTWRSLRGRPGSTMGIITVLTLGLGLATTIYALADPFLSRPLPYVEPERLAIIRIRGAQIENLQDRVVRSAPSLAEWRDRRDLFQDVAAFGPFETVRVVTPNGAGLLRIWTVSTNFIQLLTGVTPTGTWQHMGEGMVRFVAIRPESARDRLGLGTDALGAVLIAEDGRRMSVVATLPDGFLFPFTSTTYRPDALVPGEYPAVRWRDESGERLATVIARLQPGVTLPAVETALAMTAAQAGLSVQVEFLHTYLTASQRPFAIGALALGLMVVLACAANVTNLLFARGTYRARDFATRRALGAAPTDLLRLIAFETVTMALLAIASSLFAAHVTLASVRTVIPENYMALGDAVVNGRVIWFAALLATGVLSACTLTALLGARLVPAGGMHRNDGRAMRSWRFLLVASQAGVAIILLIGAAFLVRSHINLWQQETGYTNDSILVSVSYPTARGVPQLNDIISRTIEALRRLPGAADAAAGVSVGYLVDGYIAAGGPLIAAGGQKIRVVPSQVSPAFFSAVGTPILAGRPLVSSDKAGEVVVLNRAAVQRFWSDRSLSEVLGKVITVGDQTLHVVGIVQNAHDYALDRRPTPRVYVPLSLQSSGPRRVSFAVRLVPGSTVPEVVLGKAVRSVDGGAILEGVDNAGGRLAESVRDRSFATLMLGLFASAGLGVTATGTFAVVAFITARRTREIAIRIALGAHPRHVRALVMRDAVYATFIGTVAGFWVGRLLAQTMESQMYGLTTRDLLTPLLASAGLVAITALAALWPTRRAIRVDPTVALRVE
jgi:predicted permease